MSTLSSFIVNIDMIKANILIKTHLMESKPEEIVDISFKDFWEHEFQHSEEVTCFTKKQLEAHEKEFFQAGRSGVKYTGVSIDCLPPILPVEGVYNYETFEDYKESKKVK